ncbi:MAG: ribonucleoside-diphosphate reductase subunit alpha [Opitutales bacterium]
MLKISFEEDKRLKRCVDAPKEQKPRYNWGEAFGEDRPNLPQLTISVKGEDREFDVTEIADTIGTALTDLLLSREESEIFTKENRVFVADIATLVSDHLATVINEKGTHRLKPNDIYLVIEKALVEKNAHDVAKSLVFNRPVDGGAGDGSGESGSGVVRLIRRKGQVVPWNRSKIEVASRKAFLSLRMDSSPAVEIARSVTENAISLGKAFIHIEDVQDLVQEELMRQGHFKVAENYILYRAQRSADRTETEQAADGEVNQDSMIVVQRLDGETFFWDGNNLKKRVEFASIGLDLCLSSEEIEQELRRSVYSEITEEDLRKTIILNAKTLIEKDADFAKFAGRILLSYIYEETLDWDIARDGIEALRSAHAKGFWENLRRGVEIERIAPRLMEMDLERLSEAIDPSADLDFDYLGIQTLYDRYLIVDKTGETDRRLEAPQLFWMRVAMGLFRHEDEDPEGKAIQLYNLYKSRRFCSSTPTLFNSGTLHSQLSSCYLYKVEDSIESIMQRGIAENAFLSKWAGGLGGSWTSVRGTGSYIKGTNGESQGVIPFLKMHNDQLVAVNQGGKRRGSGCAYIETWHNDLLDFLELRKNTGDERRRTHDMNTANWIPDLFMKRMEKREQWTLFRSNEVPDLHETYGSDFEKRYIEYEAKAETGEIFGKTMPAIELWKKMLSMIFETGHPWITFKDVCNLRSPQDHAGIIHSSNLCTEITLNTGPEETAVCNLGSVALDNHLKGDGALDHERLRETIRIAIRALDNVIDINFYPTDAAKTANARHRPIGLGVMGLQNALFMRGVAFSSEEAVEFNDEFMEAIAYYAYEASSDLAAERGTYESYKGSKWDRGIMPQDTIDLLEEERGQPVDVPKGGKMDWTDLRAKIAEQGMRNSNCLAIAPTATISNVMGTSPCIEPTYKNLFVKSNLSGGFVVLNQFLVRDMKKNGLWSQEMLDQLKYFDGELSDMPDISDELKKKYLTAFGVEWKYLIEAAARRQKWIDQSQSVNLFLAEPDLKTLSHMYRAAWNKGLKTTYYLRTLGASNIEKATIAVRKDIRGEMATAANDNEEASSSAEQDAAAACSLEAMMNGGTCEACQ